MQTVPAAFLLGCLLAMPPQPLGDLLHRLASDDPAVRERAEAELYRLPPSALPALEAARDHPDIDVRLRLREAIPVLANRKRVAESLVTTPVRLRYVNAPLEQALADAAEQTGIALQLPEMPVERRWERLTLDTGTTSPWDAVFQVLAAARLRVEPPGEVAAVVAEDEAFRARARFMWGRRGRASLPRIEPTPLRLIDEAAPAGVVRWIQGPLCIEAGPVAGQAVVHPEPFREVALPLTFQVEPRFAFRGIAGVFLDEVRDEHGQLLPRAERLHDPALGLDYFTIPRHLEMDQLGRWWYRRQMNLPIQTLAKASHRLARVRGRVLLGIQRPAEDLARVELTPGVTPEEAAPTLDGGQVQFTKVENDGDGTWSLEFTLTHPDQGSWVGIGTDTLLDRQGNCPVRLLDGKGGVIRLGGGLIDNRNERVCLIRVSFVATKDQDGPATLIISGRRPVEIEVPFELRDVPLP